MHNVMDMDGMHACILFLQHAINSHVIMADVSQMATGVMVTMTVETTVMKMDVIVQMIQMVVQYVQSTCVMYSVY